MFNYDWEVDLVISDASNAIHLAVESVFGQNHLHAMCSVHVWRNAEKNITSFVKTEDRARQG